MQLETSAMMKRLFSAALLAFSAAAALAATTIPPQLISPKGSTAGQAIVSSGPGSAPAWGTVAAGALEPIAANTVLGNFTGSSAAPAAFTAPSCSTANSALKYTSGTGMSCGTTFALTTGDLSQFASTTSAQLAGVISNETGSGSLVFGTSPSLTTPTISGGTVNNASVGATTPSTGAFTTLSTTGTATLNGLSTGSATISGGTINGTSVGATTASTGRFTTIVATGAITPSSTAGIVGTTTNDNANAGSVGEYVTASTALTGQTAGAFFNAASVSVTAGDWRCQGTVDYVPAGTTTISQLDQGISTTSATLGAFGTYTQLVFSGPAGQTQTMMTPTVRISVASTTTVYLVGLAQFAVSTLQARGSINCTRVR